MESPSSSVIRKPFAAQSKDVPADVGLHSSFSWVHESQWSGAAMGRLTRWKMHSWGVGLYALLWYRFQGEGSLEWECVTCLGRRTLEATCHAPLTFAFSHLPLELP